MPLGNYSVNTEGCERTLTQVEEDGGRTAALAALHARLTDAQQACSGGTGLVARALEGLWLDTLLRQSDAAETRISNAAAGVRRAVQIIAEADQDMAGTSGAKLGQLHAGVCRAPSLDGTR